jgi:hypothetical protein
MVPQNQDEEIPYVGTVFGPYVGYKVLEYDGREDHRIVSCYKDKYEWWPNRTSEEADCRPGYMGATVHDRLDEKHTCGYYLFYDLDEAIKVARRFVTVRPVVSDFVALVAAWGSVVHHRLGLRSSQMEILAFHDGNYKLKDDLEEVAALMDIPYLKRGELEELAKESGVML